MVYPKLIAGVADVPGSLEVASSFSAAHRFRISRAVGPGIGGYRLRNRTDPGVEHEQKVR